MERIDAGYSYAADGIVKEAVLPSGCHRSAHGAREQLRRERRHVQPAFEAGGRADQQGARAALAEQGCAAVRLRAYAAREASVEGSLGAGRNTGSAVAP